MGVVKDVVGIQAVALTFKAGEDLVALPGAKSINVDGALVVLAVIALDKKA